MVTELRQNDILHDGDAFLLLRSTLSAHRPKALHSHDFYEIFWVQNGAVRHHLADRIDVLREGAMVFVSPTHQHALQSKGDDSMVVSLCIRSEVVEAIRDRHEDIWPMSDAPVQHELGTRALTAVNQSALVMERAQNDVLTAEAFLLPLLAGLRVRASPDDAPDWLLDAMHAAHDPKVFRQGAAGFVLATGRAHPHVSRVTRQTLKMSPTDYINQVRMAYAARQLLSDIEPVREIAADCGLPNMAHFHNLFKAAHGISPLQFRQKYRQDVIQPM